METVTFDKKQFVLEGHFDFTLKALQYKDIACLYLSLPDSGKLIPKRVTTEISMDKV